jgi:hypothetical protein
VAALSTVANTDQLHRRAISRRVSSKKAPPSPGVKLSRFSPSKSRRRSRKSTTGTTERIPFNFCQFGFEIRDPGLLLLGSTFQCFNWDHQVPWRSPQVMLVGVPIATIAIEGKRENEVPSHRSVAAKTLDISVLPEQGLGVHFPHF